MHETTINVRWGELDPYHHVNHATYLSYLEHARIAALDDLGWGMETLSGAGYQVVVVHAEMAFRAPATAGDTLVVRTRVEEVRGASSVWRQTIVRGDDVILDATIRAATTNLEGRPVRTPVAFRESLAALESS